MTSDETLSREEVGGGRGEEHLGEESCEGETERSLEVIQDEFGWMGSGRSVTLQKFARIVSLEEAISEEQKRTGISLQRVIPVSRK